MNGSPSTTFRFLDRFLADEVSVEELEAFVYASPKLEDELGAADSLDLLAFDYRQPHAGVELAKRVTAIYERRRPGSLLRDRAWRLACGLLDGSIPFLGAVRGLAHLWYADGESPGMDFVGISSELDDIPGPAEYPLWDPDALARQVDGWRERERVLADDALEAARRLLQRDFPDWPCPARGSQPQAS